jgi:nitrite reductase/ring-hydroxylating ferredoxin subunit
MANFVRAATIDQVKEGEMITCTVAGVKIALSKIASEYFAITDTCSHDKCSLSEQGFLDGTVVTCGCHGATFDVKTGAVLSLPATKSVSSYPVKIEGSDIFIGI